MSLAVVVVVIYLDTLIFINTVIDYLILSLSLRIVRCQAPLFWVIISALIGGFSSVYILVEGSNFLLDILFKFLSSLLIILLTLGFCKIKVFLKLLFVFFGLTLLYCGGLLFVCENKSGLPVYEENLTGYFDIPIIYIILFTAVFYSFMWVFAKVRRKDISSMFCLVEIFIDDNSIKVNAIIDTGNSLEDPISSSPVIIIDKEKYKLLFSKINNIDLQRRKRVIPIKTVGNAGLLNAVRCDRLKITLDGKRYEYQNVIVAESLTDLDSNTQAILPAYILETNNPRTQIGE